MSSPTTLTPPGPRPGPGGQASSTGQTTQSKVFYQDGRRRRSAEDVPVDQYGNLAGARFRCRRHGERWFPLATAAKGVPVCGECGVRMTPRPVRSSRLLPWTALRRELTPQLLAPLFALAGLVAAGAGVADATVPAPVWLLLAVPAGWVAARAVRVRLTRQAEAHGHAVDEDVATRRLAAIGRRARVVGYSLAAGVAWLTVPAVTGVDPDTLGGRVALTVLAAVWVLPASTWWRRQRRLRAARLARPAEEPPVEEPLPVEFDVPMDPTEAEVRRQWRCVVAAKKDQIIATKPDGTHEKAKRQGPLVDTWLEDWRPVQGGWAATVVGPDGQYTADKYLKTQAGIASAFKMRAPMVTIIPDPDDENRAEVLAQRTSPIRESVLWPGPDSIDLSTGTAPVVTYADGTAAAYELYRPGWGTPPVFVVGTTGSGKSVFLNLGFAIDRWTACPDPTAPGGRRGMVASFLIDPQQGQSFAPFLDDLAAPPATSIVEATLLVMALHAEMLRRNRYLARKTWVDERGRSRRGQTWWDPQVDGPILTLTIDEAHYYLADASFRNLVTAAARMWRKCGGQIRLATHTPLLSDLGGSMALRDMLSGGFVVVFRTANSLSGPVAFNGRLPVDPRTIPADPGSCYVLTGTQPKAMLGRAMWCPDWYDYVRDADDKPIGHPAVLPPETLRAFGPEFAEWVRHAADPDAEPWTPGATTAPAPEPAGRSVDAVRLALATAVGAGMAVEEVDKLLRERSVTGPNGKPFSVRTIRAALTKLVEAGEAEKQDGRHRLTDEAAAAVVEDLGE